MSFSNDSYSLAQTQSEWSKQVYDAWPAVSVKVEGPRDTQFPIGARLDVTSTVTSGGLTSDDLLVELVVGRDQNGTIEELAYVPLEASDLNGDSLRYTGGIEVRHGGSIVYGVRVLPTHPR